MRLYFPGGEHAEQELPLGETRVGSDAAMHLFVSGLGLAGHHASFYRKSHGLWLNTLAGEPLSYVNGRPVRELALLRPGDLVCLGALRIVLRSQSLPAPADGPPPVPEASSGDADPASNDLTSSSLRYLLRGVAGPRSGETILLSGAIVLGVPVRAEARVGDSRSPSWRMALLRDDDCLRIWCLDGREVEVNGWPVASAVLREGDQCAAGGERFVVEMPRPADERSLASASRVDAAVPSPPDPASGKRGWIGAGAMLLLVAGAIALVITLALI